MPINLPGISPSPSVPSTIDVALGSVVNPSTVSSVMAAISSPPVVSSGPQPAGSGNSGASVANPTSSTGSTLNPDFTEVVVSVSEQNPQTVQAIQEINNILIFEDIFNFKSEFSDPLQVNTLFIPNLEPNFIYNFYTDNEEALSNENPLNDPILNNSLFEIARYIKLIWDAAPELIDIPNTFVEALDGSGGGSIGSGIWNTDGNFSEVVDFSNPDLGFDNTANDSLTSVGIAAIASLNDIASATSFLEEASQIATDVSDITSVSFGVENI